MIDIKKTYKTRDGQLVELLSNQGRGQFPIIGYIGEWAEPMWWTLEGLFSTDDPGVEHFWDLIEIKPEPRKIKVSGWVNVYDDGQTSGPYLTKSDANCVPISGRSACKYIEFEVEEGEGL